MRSTPVLFDGNNLVARCVHATIADDRAGNIDPPTGGVGASMYALCSVVRDIEAELPGVFVGPVYVVYDAGTPAERLAAIPTYKEKRRRLSDASPTMRDVMRAQLRQSWQVMRGFGLPCVVAQGYEADDMIGAMALDFTSRDVRPIVVSSDKDLYGLIPHGVRVWSTDQSREVTRKAIRNKFKVRAAHFPLYRVLVGDASDSIGGMRGVGDKKAVKWINQYMDDYNKPLTPKAVEYCLAQIQSHLLDSAIKHERTLGATMDVGALVKLYEAVSVAGDGSVIPAIDPAHVRRSIDELPSTTSVDPTLPERLRKLQLTKLREDRFRLFGEIKNYTSRGSKLLTLIR